MAGPGVISFTRTEKYSLLVAEELKEIRDAHIFSDFKICIKGESIACHRLVLSVHSAMIKAMLTSNMAEATQNSVNLDHIDLDIMKVILDYMYQGQASFHTDHLGDLIMACDFLRINMLKDFCVDCVPSILQPANAIVWLKLSHQLSLSDVKTQCLEIIVANFTTISKQLDFVDLSLVNFQECLDHVKASSQREDDVLNAALKWVDQDATERLDHLEKLVDQVQLDHCSPQGILGIMKTYKPIITATETLYDRLTSATMEILSAKAKRPTLTIIGGQNTDGVSNVCWKLNKDNQVEQMIRIPFDDLQCNHSVCKIPKGFIISGGYDSTLCVMFNAETTTWSRLQNMMQARRSHGSVCIRGVLYVLGGYVEENRSKSVHSIMVDGGNWEEESDLPTSVSFPKVAELGESMFLLDEKRGQLYQMDVDQQEWSAKAPLSTESYHGISMTAFNGKLYIAGKGIFAWYIPATNTWIPGQLPLKQHNYGSLVPHDGKLLLLGGSWKKGTDEVEEFCLEDEAWTVCSWKMPAPLLLHHALVLDMPEKV